MHFFTSILLPIGLAAAKVERAGVNIAGFDFGCTTDGACDIGKIYAPLKSHGGPDGIGQMQHFRYDLGLNIFRLPVAWQYLTNNVLGGALDGNNAATYDELVQGCLGTGALCIIDIHNYARWYSGIVGQGGVKNSDLTSLWSQLASKYRGNGNVVFGLMNEPHDLDINTWAGTVQECVNAIRGAGANSQMILIPGTNYAAAGGFAQSSGPALNGVHNPDGSKGNLIFDVHQYLDGPNYSGTTRECSHDGTDSLADTANWLRNNGRRAILSETGGGNTASCQRYVCAEIDWMNYHSDVYLGWVGWAAGSFDQSYELVETPTYTNGHWVDTALVSSCIAGKFNS